MSNRTPHGIDFQHEIPCPARIGPKDTGAISSGTQPQEIWTASGWWSNVDIYVEVPESWQTASILLTLFAVTNGARAIIATTTIPGAGLEPLFVSPGVPGSRRGIVLSGRGHPASAWSVTAVNGFGTPVASGTISGEVWGDQSTPDGVGFTPGRTIPDKAMPSRAGHGMVLPALVPPALVRGPWVPMLGTLSGSPIVVVAGPAPGSVGEQSRFVQFGTLADALVLGAPGRVFSATAANTTGPQKFFQLHNKLGALVLGDVPAISLAVPANSTVVLGNDFFGPPLAASPLLGGLFFSAAIRWGWSTTRATYTAAPAGTQQTQILFA